jgi:hypothetical protein
MKFRNEDPIAEGRRGNRLATAPILIPFDRPKSSCTCASQSRPSASFLELRHTVPSDANIISPLAAQLMRFIKRFRDGDNFDIELALREALGKCDPPRQPGGSSLAH